MDIWTYKALDFEKEIEICRCEMNDFNKCMGDKIWKIRKELDEVQNMIDNVEIDKKIKNTQELIFKLERGICRYINP